MRLTERKKETDFSEGLNRALTALFIHTGSQVVGSSLAKFLTLKKHRFRFSHDFCYIPVDDIFDLLNKKGINVNILQDGI